MPGYSYSGIPGCYRGRGPGCLYGEILEGPAITVVEGPAAIKVERITTTTVEGLASGPSGRSIRITRSLSSKTTLGEREN